MQTTNDKRFRVGLALLAATAFAAIVLAAWALYVRFEQTNAYRDADTRIWTAVICQIEQAVQKQHLPPAKEQAALRFYDRLLIRDVQTDGCGLLKGPP